MLVSTVCLTRYVSLFFLSRHLLHLIERPIALVHGRVTERAPYAVPQRQVLAVVVVIVDVMVHVVGRAVDERLQRLRDTVVAVVYRDRPHVDEKIEDQVDELVHREEEHVDVVRETLSEAVQGMEGVTGERARDLPLVVWLVYLVDERMVQPPVDPVDDKVSEHDERHERPGDTPPACSKAHQ